MSNQNYLIIGLERLGGIMLDDRSRKASDIYRAAVKRQKKEDYNPTVRSDGRTATKSVFEKGGVCFYVTPKGADVRNYFFYIHAGGFISQISSAEWRFVYEAVEKTGYGAVVPIYPLAPGHGAAEALDMLAAAYTKVCSREDVERIVLLGCEAGGGLALSLAIHLWKNGVRRPDKLVLASPVLDTQFTDTELERKISDKKKFMRRYFYSPGIKHFLDKYWVRGAETDIASPIYSDLTDICDDMAIFTVDDDLLNCYAGRLYENVKRLNMKIHYYQFHSVAHDYIEHPLAPECRAVIRKIEDSLQGESDLVPAEVEDEVWRRSMMAERYPKLYEDNESIRLADKLGIEHKNRNAMYTFYDRTVNMERLIAIDRRVRGFIDRYADGIIVNVGCELDTMFSRVDNGRIKWYNIDLPERMELRRRYIEPRDRETSIDKSILDFTWLEQIQKPQDVAILFVLCNKMQYFSREKLREFMDSVWQRFPGAEVVFDAKNSVEKRRWNRNVLRGRSKGSLMRVSIDNCTSLMYDWNIKYKILCDETLLRADELEIMYSPDEAKKFRHAIKKKYDKVVHLRLGTEHFLQEDDG